MEATIVATLSNKMTSNSLYVRNSRIIYESVYLNLLEFFGLHKEILVPSHAGASLGDHPQRGFPEFTRVLDRFFFVLATLLATRTTCDGDYLGSFYVPIEQALGPPPRFLSEPVLPLTEPGPFLFQEFMIGHIMTWIPIQEGLPIALERGLGSLPPHRALPLTSVLVIGGLRLRAVLRVARLVQ